MKENKTKIGFVVYNEYPGILPTGGIGVFVKNLSEGLIGGDIEPEVILIVDKEISIETNSNIPIHRVVVKKSSNSIDLLVKKFHILRDIENIVRQNGIEYVEISTSDTFLLRPLKGVNVLARTHGSLSYALKQYSKKIGFFSKWIQLRHERVLLKSSIQIIAISQQYFEHYVKYHSKLVLIENFIGPEFDNKATYEPTFDKPYLFFHGTLKDIKGVKELATAFIQAGLDKNYLLVMAGKSSPSMLADIRNICGSSLVHLGECDAEKLKEYIGNAELSVYPSKRDAFNLAVVEAMSQGSLVLVSSAIDATIIQDGVNGFRFPTSDFKILNRYLIKSLQRSEVEKQNMVLQALKDVQLKFCYSVGVSRNTNFYKNLILTNDKN